MLKAWNKTLGEKNNILNSFSICLLLLGFMITKDYLPNLQRLAVEEKREQEISWLYYNYDKSKKTGTYEKKTAQIAFLDESEFELVDKLWLQKKTTDK